MFDTKFELDSHFGDAAPPPPKRKEKKDLSGLHRWPETAAEKACTSTPLPSDHNVYSLLFTHFEVVV